MIGHPVWNGFFVLEGIDGSGTTTQLKRLQARAQSRGRSFSATNEPTGGPVGRLIRSVLRGQEKVHPGTLARLFGADRHEHLFGQGGVRDLLKSGCAVLSDRYFLSSLAYQSLNSPLEEVWKINEDFPLPQVLFFLDLEPETALARVEARGGEKEIFETLEFQKKVRKKYLEMVDFLKSRGADIRILDATESPETIENRIWEMLESVR